MNYSFFIRNLPSDVVSIVTSYCDPETDYWNEKIKAIITEHQIKCWSNFDIKNIIRCMEEIPYIFKPLKTAYNIHSYGAKHTIEAYRDKFPRKNLGNYYCPMYEFEIAMILLGYPRKRGKINSSYRGSRISEKKWKPPLKEISLI
jgi:hypothetical protein